MKRTMVLWAALLALPAAVAGGLTYAGSRAAGGYICPVTGETLPCERCCPLNQARASDPAEAKGYTCPITGEELACPNCCPLNQSK